MGKIDFQIGQVSSVSFWYSSCTLLSFSFYERIVVVLTTFSSFSFVVSQCPLSWTRLLSPVSSPLKNWQVSPDKSGTLTSNKWTYPFHHCPCYSKSPIYLPTYEKLFKLCLFCYDSYRGFFHHFVICVYIYDFPPFMNLIIALSIDDWEIPRHFQWIGCSPSMTQDSWDLAQRRSLLPLLMDFIWLSLKCLLFHFSFFCLLSVAGPSFILSLEMRWLFSLCRSISLKETSASN